MNKNIDKKIEYIEATLLEEDLLGAIVFVNPEKREQFSELYKDRNIDLKDCFRVTQVFNDACSILYRNKVYRVKTDLFLTKNPTHQLY